VYEKVADRVVARPLQRVTVKGRYAGLVVYELLGLAGSADPELEASARDISRCRATAEQWSVS